MQGKGEVIMYQHHRESIDRMIAYYHKRPEVIALFLTGSVANQNERVDSDLDGVVIVSDEYYQERKNANRLEESVL